MVSKITCYIKKQHVLSYMLLILCTDTHANIFNDMVSGIKSAVREVDNFFTTAGQKIKEGWDENIKARFKDTKTTRAIDYAVRKAAFESALGIATKVLDLAKEASTGTLALAEKTGEAGLSAGEHFLSDVVRVASPAILQKSADVANGTLEVVKQAGVGVLKGTEWVVTLATTTFDINRIRYQGDLKRLKTGVLGDMLCEGTAFKKDFSFKFDLDPRDMKSIGTSLEKIFKDFERLFNENVANPIKNAFVPLKQQAAVVANAEKALQQPPPAISTAVASAVDAANKASQLMAKLSKLEQDAAAKLAESVKKLQEIASKNNKELEALIRQGTQSSSYDSQLARQEMIKRLTAKK